MTDTSVEPARSLTMDLNADLGEGFPWDRELLGLVTSASICCGEHASTPEEIQGALREAVRRGVVIGAHPGFPDREGFGRRPRKASADEVHRLIVDQVMRLSDWAKEQGGAVAFLKPHGALYNLAQVRDEIAIGVVSASRFLDLPVLGLLGRQVDVHCRARGGRFIAEGFADRAERPDGTLVPRGEPGAILEEPAAIASHVVRLASRGIDTICVHGDDPQCVATARIVCAALASAGLTARSFV